MLEDAHMRRNSLVRAVSACELQLCSVRALWSGLPRLPTLLQRCLLAIGRVGPFQRQHAAVSRTLARPIGSIPLRPEERFWLPKARMVPHMRMGAMQHQASANA